VASLAATRGRSHDNAVRPTIGAAPAHLWVFEKNPRAQAFYAKQGFLFDGHRKVDDDTSLWERRFVRC
jgi:hypothetical protein